MDFSHNLEKFNKVNLPIFTKKIICVTIFSNLKKNQKMKQKTKQNKKITMYLSAFSKNVVSDMCFTDNFEIAGMHVYFLLAISKFSDKNACRILYF